MAEKGFGTRVEIRAAEDSGLSEADLERLLDDLAEPQQAAVRQRLSRLVIDFRAPDAREEPDHPRGEARLPARAARGGDQLRLRGGGREAAREGQADRPRAGREAARPRLLRGARHLRPPPHLRLRDAEETALGRRRRHRPRHDRRPHRLRLLPGLHRLRRQPRRGDGGEDVQGDGPRRPGRGAGGRHQRLRRRPHPGGRRLARRLRRRLRPQRQVLRRDPADQPDHGPLRRRRRLLAGDDRLHLHGQRDLPHVHHRPRSDQDGDRRGGRVRGAGRGDEPQLQVRRRPLRRRGRGELPARTPATCSASCPPTTSRRRRASSPATTPSAKTRSSTRWSPTIPPSPTTCAR